MGYLMSLSAFVTFAPCCRLRLRVRLAVAVNARSKRCFGQLACLENAARRRMVSRHCLCSRCAQLAELSGSSTTNEFLTTDAYIYSNIIICRLGYFKRLGHGKGCSNFYAQFHANKQLRRRPELGTKPKGCQELLAFEANATP